MVFDPSSVGIKYTSHQIPVNKKEKVYVWELHPKGEERGVIVHFHGNAENISTHVGAVAWLSEEGYRVFLMDYRGFGGSDGKAGVRNAVEDIRETFKWVNNNISEENNLKKPLVIFSQSIGASLTLYALSDKEYLDKLDAIILESPFSSYRKIVREKIRDTIIFYPFAYPFSLLFTSCCSPLEGAKKINSKPIRMIIVNDDKIVGPDHGRILYDAVPSKEKELWVVEQGGHNSFMTKPENREKVLEFIRKLSE